MKTFKRSDSTTMSRVVRGGFPDRQFDVDFWQAQGDEAIFEAAWEMAGLAEEFKGSNVELKPDFKDLLRLLNHHHVSYLMVGGYAVMKYTEPFYTKDMDIWVAPTPENAERAYAALVEFGAPMADLTVSPPGSASSVSQIEVPLAGIAAGEYLVEIAAAGDGGDAKELVGFRVTG